MITKRLFELQDLNYKEFHSKLMPTIEKERIIGIRIPVLRSFAKEISKTKEADEFINSLPHYYYEENNLHAFLTEQIKDYDSCIECVNRFLPFVDNWATCDSLRPKCFKSNKAKLEKQIDEWLKSEHIYTVRFGIEMLMVHFLDADFKPEHLKKVAEINTNEYYLEMMIAWYFATALAKQYEAAVPFLEERRLSPSIHAKTIQKAAESYRITDDKKRYLKSIK